jgi:uncharacterized membrane protein YuzA (DUF378 family)
MRVLYKIALTLVLIGALNWGLVGFFDFNLVTAIFGVGSVLSRIVFALVGLSGVWVIVAKLMPASTSSGVKPVA